VSRDPDPRAAADGLFAPPRRALVVGLLLTITLVASESLAISTVMPIVARALGGLELYGWVFSAFFLGSLVGIVVVGGLIDRGGLRGPFVAGISLFAVGLLIGGLAPTMPILVAGRFLQGLGAGAVPPIAYVSIGRALPDRLRPGMFALLSGAWVIPGIVGPTLAAAVALAFDWRAVFLGLLPLVGVGGALTFVALGRVAGPKGTGVVADGGRAADRDAPEVDPGLEHAAELRVAASARRRLPLALLVAAGAALVLEGLTNGSPAVLAIGVGCGLVMLVPAFARLTPAGTLRLRPGLPSTVLLRGILTFAFFAADAYVPLAIQGGRGESAVLAGIANTVVTLTWTTGAWIQSRTSERIGPERLVRSGFGLVVLGVAGFATLLVPSVPVAASIGLWGLAGLGMGMAYASLSVLILRRAPAGEVGAATSALQLSDVLGTALGTGIGGAVVAVGVRAGAGVNPGLAVAFGLAGAVGLAGLAASERLGSPRSE
jgi:MFS family permease